jgi:hypothetical protein
MGTAEIAAALREGGITSSANNFTGNVSAVLSVMANKKGEIQSFENKFVISPTGKQAWAHIRALRQTRQESLISPSIVQ